MQAILLGKFGFRNGIHAPLGKSYAILARKDAGTRDKCRCPTHSRSLRISGLPTPAKLSTGRCLIFPDRRPPLGKMGRKKLKANIGRKCSGRGKTTRGWVRQREGTHSSFSFGLSGEIPEEPWETTRAPICHRIECHGTVQTPTQFLSLFVYFRTPTTCLLSYPLLMSTLVPLQK